MTVLLSLNPKQKTAQAKQRKTEDDARLHLILNSKKSSITLRLISATSIIMKTLGLGPTAPVVVYVNDKRWEVFPV